MDIADKMAEKVADAVADTVADVHALAEKATHTVVEAAHTAHAAALDVAMTTEHATTPKRILKILGSTVVTNIARN